MGLAVMAGHLPDSSLHRLDFGVSFGLMASVGTLTGLLNRWLRAAVLTGVGLMLEDLVEFADPLTNWATRWRCCWEWRAGRSYGDVSVVKGAVDRPGRVDLVPCPLTLTSSGVEVIASGLPLLIPI